MRYGARSPARASMPRFTPVLGAAGLAIGLALQGTLQNIAAGLMLLLLRLFRVGDYIEGTGTTAETSNEIGLSTTRG